MVEATYDEKIQLALESVEVKEEQKDEVVLSSGVILKLKKVNILRIQAILDRFKPPEVPLVKDEDKGRLYRNPADPSYQEAVSRFESERTMAVLDAIAALGTEILFKPDEVPALEDDSWIEELEVLEIPVLKDSKLARYQAWVKYVAIVDADDLLKIGQQFGMALGVSESRVAEQLRSNFPDNT